MCRTEIINNTFIFASFRDFPGIGPFDGKTKPLYIGEKTRTFAPLSVLESVKIIHNSVLARDTGDEYAFEDPYMYEQDSPPTVEDTFDDRNSNSASEVSYGGSARAYIADASRHTLNAVRLSSNRAPSVSSLSRRNSDMPAIIETDEYSPSISGKDNISVPGSKKSDSSIVSRKSDRGPLLKGESFRADPTRRLGETPPKSKSSKFSLFSSHKPPSLVLSSPSSLVDVISSQGAPKEVQRQSSLSDKLFTRFQSSNF